MKLSDPKIEGVLHASKHLTHRALLDTAEMQSLLESLPSFSIYNVSEIVTLQNARFSIEDFLAKYIDYVAVLKAGVPLDEAPFKRIFSTAFSASSKALYAMKVKEGEYIIKPIKPVVQLSLHHFIFSKEQRRFHSMVHSEESISWGLQFSYPQIYTNSLGGEVVEVFKDRDDPNTKLFQALAKWMRGATTPVPFNLDGKKTNATFRLGRGCFSWIHSHPHLSDARLEVVAP
ncbi:MAG: hypothetical protein K1060chlam2_00603 [Chlamydiae bacterium]|nr:hypothetical protein [Chlamydiota bacterium]